MALTDPQSIDIGAGAISLPRTVTKGAESSYTSADGTITLTLSTVVGKRKRQVIRVDVTKITSDPFIPTQNTSVSMSTYIVIDRPPAGFENTDALAILEGLLTLGKAGTSKVFKQLLGSES